MRIPGFLLFLAALSAVTAETSQDDRKLQKNHVRKLSKSSSKSSFKKDTITLKVTNLSWQQPFGGVFVMTHDAHVDPLFTLGEEASEELALLAENGSPGPLVDLYSVWEPLLVSRKEHPSVVTLVPTPFISIFRTIRTTRTCPSRPWRLTPTTALSLSTDANFLLVMSSPDPATMRVRKPTMSCAAPFRGLPARPVPAIIEVAAVRDLFTFTVVSLVLAICHRPDMTGATPWCALKSCIRH